MISAFRFSASDDGEFSPEMKSAFDEFGFVVLEGFKSEAECAALTARAHEIVDDFDPADAGIFASRRPAAERDEYFRGSGDKVRCFLEEEAVDGDGNLVADKAGAVNKIGHAMHDLDEAFDDFSHSPALASLAKGVGFRDARLLQSMFIFKPPRISGEVSWHQDGTYLYTEPESVVGFWFALDDATVENGCLWAIPGGHKQGLRSRFMREGESLSLKLVDETPLDIAAAVPLEAVRGDMVILHGRLPHASEPNRSDVSRHAYTLHVIDGTCEYPESNWLRRDPDFPLRGFQ